MALKKIHIENFKSIGDIEIVDPQPFSVLVGPNAAGKSNIFAALQFLHYCTSTKPQNVAQWLGGSKSVLHMNAKDNYLSVNLVYEGRGSRVKLSYADDYPQGLAIKGGIAKHDKEVSDIDLINKMDETISSNPDYGQFLKNYSRIFVGKHEIVFQQINDDSKLAPDASNLEKVLKRILNDPEIKDEFIEILQLFVPGLDKVDVVSSEFSSNLDLLVYEQAHRHRSAYGQCEQSYCLKIDCSYTVGHPFF